VFFLQSQVLSARTSMTTEPAFTKGASTSAGSQIHRKRPPVPCWDVGVISGPEVGPPAAVPVFVEGSVEDVWWLPLHDTINIVTVSITEALVLSLTIVLNRRTQKLSAGPRPLASVWGTRTCWLAPGALRSWYVTGHSRWVRRSSWCHVIISCFAQGVSGQVGEQSQGGQVRAGGGVERTRRRKKGIRGASKQ
jgi:hypothetical protein